MTRLTIAHLFACIAALATMPAAHAAFDAVYIEFATLESRADYRDSFSTTTTPPGTTNSSAASDYFDVEGYALAAAAPFGERFYARLRHRQGDLTSGCACTDMGSTELAAGYRTELSDDAELYAELGIEQIAIGDDDGSGATANFGLRYALADRFEFEADLGLSSAESAQLGAATKLGGSAVWWFNERVGVAARFERATYDQQTASSETVLPGPVTVTTITTIEYETSLWTLGLRVRFP